MLFRSSRTHATLFAGATASSVVATTREKEPDVVEAIVARGAGLPEGHPSIPLLPALTEQANASRANYKTWADASKREDDLHGHGSGAHQPHQDLPR